MLTRGVVVVRCPVACLQVYAVVAKIYYSNAFGELGFPAFDHKHNLVR
jgi:hypothetical protein